MKFALAVLVAATAGVSVSSAFVPTHFHQHRTSSISILQSSRTTDDDSFATFAASLEDAPSKKQSASSSRSRASTTRPSTVKKDGDATTTTSSSWQADLERLLDPLTPLAQRQILLSNLMNANEEIQASVQAALKDRKIDPLLTPTGRKLQEGTRAVARQLTNDILPSLRPTPPSNNNAAALPTIPLPPLPNPQDFSKFGNRFISAVSNQMQRNLSQLQQDLANPSQIPSRISQQTEDFLQEASNIFSETPVGLKEPSYTVVATTNDYEIRDYEGYTVATTSMGSATNANNALSAEQGVAFNTLAAYIFGNNADDKVLDMTTPVTTTASGEMRFFLSDDTKVPAPLSEDAAQHQYDGGKIRIERIPDCRLAVRRFGGFATQGEIMRQKAALLAALQMDDAEYEIDVPHGQTVGHIIFQYNPPYTLPALRRNEIAVPVLKVVEDETSQSGSDSSSSSASRETVAQVDDPWDLTTTNGEATAKSSST